MDSNQMLPACHAPCGAFVISRLGKLASIPKPKLKAIATKIQEPGADRVRGQTFSGEAYAG
jgi:hypothetical protein